MSQQNIPVVDLAHFVHGDADAQARFVEQLGRSLVEFGFVAVANHGLDSKALAGTYEELKHLFDLPAATKLGPGASLATLVRTEYFIVQEALSPSGGAPALAEGIDGPRVLIVLTGSVSMQPEGGSSVVAPAGTTALIPASLIRTCKVKSQPETRVLIVSLQ